MNAPKCLDPLYCNSSDTPKNITRKLLKSACFTAAVKRRIWRLWATSLYWADTPVFWPMTMKRHYTISGQATGSAMSTWDAICAKTRRKRRTDGAMTWKCSWKGWTMPGMDWKAVESQDGWRIQKCIRQGNVLQNHEFYRNNKASGFKHLPQYYVSYGRRTSYTITGLFAVL